MCPGLEYSSVEMALAFFGGAAVMAVIFGWVLISTHVEDQEDEKGKCVGQ